jgi:hypothetical protein
MDVMRSTAAALAVGVSLLAVTGSPAKTPQMEVVGVSSDRQGPAEPNPQEPPEPNLPGPLAPLASDKDGRLVLDEDGNQVMIPVTPPDGAVAVLPPGSTRRTVTAPDGSVGEQVSIVYK